MKVLKFKDGTELVPKAEALAARKSGAQFGYHPHTEGKPCGANCMRGSDSYQEEIAELRASMVPVDAAPAHTSDGFHTFAELYRHRNILTALAFTMLAGIQGESTTVWKSWAHHNGGPEMYHGFFIAGADLPTGQISYHLPRAFWELVHCPEIQQAPEFDGYEPDDVVDRIHEFLLDR